MIEQLLNEFGISPLDQANIVSQLRPFRFEKNQILENPHDEQRHIYFIKQGILRVYYYNEDAEINSYFAAENNYISAFTAIISPQSEQYMAALEGGLAMRMTAEFYQSSFAGINGWQALGRHMAEQNYICMADRLINYNHLTAAQKFQKFQNDFGDGVTERIADYHIASYLGITPESLSRIKHK